MVYVSVFNVADLRKVLQYIEKNGVQNIFERFPFTELSSTEAMDYECVRYQLKVLEQFLDIDAFFDGDCLSYIIDYLLQNFKFMVKSKNDALLPVLDFLRQVFLSYRHMEHGSSYNFPVDQIGNLLIGLFNSQQEIAEKRQGVLLLTNLLSIPNIKLPDSELIAKCVEQCFEILNGEYAVDLCRLTYAVLRVMPETILPKGRVSNWLFRQCPVLFVETTDELVLYELLKCLLQMYKGGSCLKLSHVYVKKIDVFCTLLSNASLNEYCTRVLRFIIRDMCILDRLPRAAIDDATFVEELNSLLTLTCLDSSTEDIIFVLFYLQYLNDESFTVAEHVVARAILTNYYPGKAYSLPILKALCLLYPVIIENGEYSNINKIIIGEDIMSALFKSKHFTNLITYNPDQLSWILARARYPLRLKTLFLWLINFEANAIILAVIDTCEAGQLLVDIVVHSEIVDKSVSQRAAQLLGQLRTPSVGKILRRSLISSKSIGSILQAKPDFPSDEKEGVFFCKVMSCRLPYVEDQNTFVLCCYYSKRLLTHFRRSSEGVEQFCWNKKCLEKVLQATSSRDDCVALAGIKLLKTLTILQKRHETKMPESWTIDFKRLLKGSAEKLSEALLLLYAIFGSNAPVPVVKLPKKCNLALLHCLFDIEGDDSVTAKQYRMLRRLLQVEKTVGRSSLTPLFVRAQCLRPVSQTYIEELLLFLKEWMVNLYGLEFYALPFGLFEKFLRGMRHHPYDEQVDELLVLLYKWRNFDSD